MISCNKDGDYQYVITMKDGSKVKAWSISANGGGLSVMGPWGSCKQYHLSSDAYIRADFVGVKNN